MDILSSVGASVLLGVFDRVFLRISAYFLSLAIFTRTPTNTSSVGASCARDLHYSHPLSFDLLALFAHNLPHSISYLHRQNG